MPWGDNPTGRELICPYCAATQIDDANPPTHEQGCYYRFWWRRLARAIRRSVA